MPCSSGVYWYARNAIATGNPIPFIASVGPIDLPARRATSSCDRAFSVAHYWNDTEVWSDWFIPGLNESFGFLWPVTILAHSSAPGSTRSWRGAMPVLRMLGAVSLVHGGRLPVHAADCRR